MGVKVLKVIDYSKKDLKYIYKETKRSNGSSMKLGINAAPKKKYMSLYEKRMRCITVFFHARKRNRSILFVPNYIEFNSDLTLGKLVSLPAIISKYKRKIPNEFRIKKFKRRLAKGSKISREKAVNIKISKC
jgi:hypothetical protein